MLNVVPGVNAFHKSLLIQVLSTSLFNAATESIDLYQRILLPSLLLVVLGSAAPLIWQRPATSTGTTLVSLFQFLLHLKLHAIVVVARTSRPSSSISLAPSCRQLLLEFASCQSLGLADSLQQH